MTYDPHGQYGNDPRYQQGQYPPQYPQNPQYPQSPQGPQYPPTNPYSQSPAYPSQPDPYAQPGANDPTAPVVPYGGGGGSYGANDPYGGGQYGGGSAPPYGGGSAPPYGGGSAPPYGADPYGAAPSSGWPAPPGSVPPGGIPPNKPKTGLIVGLAAGAVVLVLVLGGLAVVGTRLLGNDDTENPPPTNIAGPGGSPTGDPSAEPPNSDPFADTPAANFASGEEGIQLPEATEAGQFSAEEVEDTLNQVRDSLIATRLDEAMLFDHDPESFISTMSQDNQDSLRQAFSDGEFGYFATQIAEGAELAVPEPRVQGTVTFEATQDQDGFNVIEVVTKFVWAYAFVVPNGNPDLDGVVVVRDELVWQVAAEDEVDESSQGLWLWDGSGYASGIDCEAFDQSLLAPQSELSTGSGEGPSEGEIYDPEGSLDLPDTC